MTERQFIEWLRDYLKNARDTKDNVLIATMLESVVDSIQSNPYWSVVSTTVGKDTPLNYSITVDEKSGTYSVTNYKQK